MKYDLCTVKMPNGKNYLFKAPPYKVSVGMQCLVEDSKDVGEITYVYRINEKFDEDIVKLVNCINQNRKIKRILTVILHKPLEWSEE